MIYGNFFASINSQEEVQTCWKTTELSLAMTMKNKYLYNQLLLNDHGLHAYSRLCTCYFMHRHSIGSVGIVDYSPIHYFL